MKAHYKRIPLILFFVVIGITMSAQTGVEWKHALIEDVNAGRFTDAIAKMPYASWEFDYDVMLHVDKAVTFYNYCDSLNFQPSCRLDSFAVLLARTFMAYGFYYRDNQQDYAITCYSDACKVFEDRPNLSTHLEYAFALSNLGFLYMAKIDYTQAELYYLKALPIIKDHLGTHSNDYAILLGNLGQTYWRLGKYLQSRQCLSEASLIYKEILGEKHPTYASSLTNLGVLSNDMGDYALTEQYLLEALYIRKEVLEANHPDYAKSYSDVGCLYMDIGDFAKAEHYLLEALRIQKDVLGEKHKDYAGTINNLAVLYFRMKQYTKAKQYILEALAIRKEVLGEKHPDYATSLGNIGSLYVHFKEYVKAKEYFNETKKIYAEIYGTHHPEYAKSLLNLGHVYFLEGNFSLAEVYMLDAIDIYKNTVGEKNISYTILLNHLAQLYLRLGEYQKAEQYLLEELDINEDILIGNNPNYVNSLDNLSYFYTNMGDYSKAELYISRALSLYKQVVLSCLAYMSELERGIFIEGIFVRLKEYIRFYTSCFRSPISAYNLLLFTKGLQLSMTNAVKRSIMESGDSTLIADFEHLVTLKAYINKMETENPTSPNLAQAREQAETLEKDLTRRSTAFRENQRQWEINWKDVQVALPKKSIAIEFADVSNDTCVALILGEKDKEPRMIALSADDITNRTIWNKLMPEIKGAQTIYFSPEGALHQLPLESFAYDSISIMSDHFNMVRLSSTRELVLNKPSERRESAVLYGGIQYDVSSDDLLAQSLQYDESTLLAHRGIADDTTNRGSVQYLPGTRIEVETIERVLQTNQISPRLYTASAANEESFKALSGQKQNILHIGTHGFCWPDSTAQKKEFFTQRMRMIGEDQFLPQTIDPLDRCGLLFAGANIALSGHSRTLPSSVQDGILTAKEISLMDLRHCDLVVLSACETARGDVTGEGVFGLQRGFKKAGVQTIIMSLWPVDDKATQMLMTEFYRNWIEKHQTKREALKNAQNAVRYAVDEYGDPMFENPVYWAGFIMMD